MTHPTDALRLVPVDTGPNFSDSSLPLTMIHAGADAIDRATDDMANYVSGETIDWDSGMMAVAVYRSMLAAAPASPLPEGGGDMDWQSIAMWMGFSASVIKSGEPWSDQCQQHYDEAKAAFARLAAPTGAK